MVNLFVFYILKPDIFHEFESDREAWYEVWQVLSFIYIESLMSKKKDHDSLPGEILIFSISVTP